MIFSATITIVLLVSLVYFLLALSKFNHRIILFTIYMLLIFFIWSPEVSTVIANYFGIGRGLDMFFILLGVTMINAILLLARHLAYQQKLLTDLARKLAIIHASKIDDEKVG